ncbi:MAG: nucleoside-diphosphate kinase [Phycisphaerae bacterium]
MEKSLIICKPDAVQRGLVGDILNRFENKGLKIIAMKMIRVSRELAERHYAEHKGKDFFDDVVNYITSGPVVVAVLAGPSTVTVIRQMLGSTDGRKAPPGTIRGDFAVSIRYNLVHGSDSVEAAEREVDLFFTPEELLKYDRDVLKWVWQLEN